MTEVYQNLSPQDIALIFQTYLECPDYGTCDQCVLNEYKIQGRPISCLTLCDMAMKKVIEMFENEDKVNGKNKR